MQIQYTTPLKTCTKCGESKPATTEYFHANKSGKYGLRAYCKECAAAYRVENKERVAEYMRLWHQANRERRNEASRQRRAANPEKARQRFRVYYAANKEKVLAKNRAYYAANKEHHDAITRAWYEANKEQHKERSRRYRLVHRDHLRERAAAWRAAHPEIVRNYTLRYRARKQAAEGTHTAADIRAQYEQQNGRCYYCGCKVDDSYHVDHVVPLSRGGTNWPDNLVIACRHCNVSKHNKLPHEWPEGGRLL